ncbi:hypothetical protein I5677_15445 [Mobilitalea sibirica]|uniref:YmaF-like protein n=1 Tax=Mobilitalea sibirica TaxID=1462919 RepID=A0A8J7KX93_9FIRM|nr:YmaF family protein [Mobilitalea sibirica]MBH1942295.1 hypothetical protein [Mobilitalea sibirica]
MGYRDRGYYPRPYPEEQRHVHEIQGSVKTAGAHPHEHRFCTVSGEAIPYGSNDHVHDVIFRTDYHGEHYHEFKGKTGCMVRVGDRHVHYLESITSIDDGHKHRFECATLIENPTGEGHY